MKKFLCITLALIMMFSLTTVFAEEEFSDNANIEYDYNEDYDETERTQEETSSNFDGSDTSYDAAYDESSNNNGPNEPSEENYGGNSGISVYVNGNKVKFDVQPVLINNRTMVPLRAIFEALGANVTWDNATSTAKGVLGATTVEITIGKSKMYKNGEAKDLDSPATIISSRTLVPVRAIAESFDCIVNWYDATQTVEIMSMN